MKRMNLALLLSLAALVVSCGCTKSRELPDVPVAFSRYNTGLSMHSGILKSNVAYDILLPDGYMDNPEKRYPVVYCFHGYGDNNTSWNGEWMRAESKIKTLESNGLEPMIYVFPMGYKSYYVNFYDGSFNYMDMFVKEFVPMIDETYRTIADREHRATIGYSMGGFGAMVMAMKNPEVFSMSAPLSMSFRTDEQYMTEGPQSGWDSQWGRIFGGYGQAGEARLTDYYKGHCPFYQFTEENRGTIGTVRWFFTCGDDEEQLLIANDDLHVLLMDNGYDHEYRVGNGGHSSTYWRAALEEVLPWFQNNMNGNGVWDKSLVDVRTSEIDLDENGAFISKGYVDAGNTGVIVYFVHDGLSEKSVRDAVSIVSRGNSAKAYVVLPCDITKKSFEEWREYYEASYKSSSKQAIALGKAGVSVMANQSEFTSVYFDNAELPEQFSVSNDRFYFIGQSDEDSHYHFAGQLYKACKYSGVDFQYRCRNQVSDSEQNLLIGIEMIKQNLNL